MATKRVSVRKAGEGTVTDIEVNETTTAADVLRSVGCTTDGEYFVSLAAGEPPLGLTEPVIDRVKDGGKLHVTPKADAGSR